MRHQSRLVTAGYIGAVVLPVVGLVIGIVLLVRGERGAGGGVIALSVVAAIVWTALFGT